MSEQKTFYEWGHLIAAAIRLHTHQSGTPPTPEQVAEALRTTTEKVLHAIHKMEEVDAVRIVSGSFGDKLVLGDHRRIEELEGFDVTPEIDDEVEAFKQAQAKKHEELARLFDKNYKDEEKEKQKEDLAAKIADPSKLKKADNPLDAMFKKKS